MRLYGKDTLSDPPRHLSEGRGPGIIVFEQGRLLDGWFQRGTWVWKQLPAPIQDCRDWKSERETYPAQWLEPILHT